MKTKPAVLALAAIVSAFAVPALAASSTHQLNVSATVNPVCRFNTAGPTAINIVTPVNGSAIDPAEAPSDATGANTVLFRCSTGTTSVISAGNGSHFGTARNVCVGATTVCMPYALTMTGDAQTGSGLGAGQDKTLTVNAKIVSTDYQNATPGSYTDTVQLSITP